MEQPIGRQRFQVKGIGFRRRAKSSRSEPYLFHRKWDCSQPHGLVIALFQSGRGSNTGNLRLEFKCGSWKDRSDSRGRSGSGDELTATDFLQGKTSSIELKNHTLRPTYHPIRRPRPARYFESGNDRVNMPMYVPTKPPAFLVLRIVPS